MIHKVILCYQVSAQTGTGFNMMATNMMAAGAAQEEMRRNEADAKYKANAK
jgi:hypothetical protein